MNQTLTAIGPWEVFSPPVQTMDAATGETVSLKDVVGGETYARVTLEYRHPLYATTIPGTSRRQEMFRMILFMDAGVLDPDAWSLDVSEYRAAVGFGFGLISPIPISFNFGWPIQEGEGDDTEVFSFRLSFR